MHPSVHDNPQRAIKRINYGPYIDCYTASKNANFRQTIQSAGDCFLKLHVRAPSAIIINIHERERFDNKRAQGRRGNWKIKGIRIERERAAGIYDAMKSIVNGQRTAERVIVRADAHTLRDCGSTVYVLLHAYTCFLSERSPGQDVI